MTENEVRDFWEANPCGATLVGDLTVEARQDYAEFFDRYDRYRYKKEPHILRNLDAIDLKDKRVLEIGLGQGADAEQLALRGAIYSGVDLTEESVKRVKMRFEIKGLSFDRIEHGSALSLPFEDNSFDIVFSHGVLHHIPEIKKASAEIARVLKPDGELVAMLYAKRSLNYLVAIAGVRRVALLGAYLVGSKADGIVGGHLKNAREKGIWNYLRLKNFVHANTDGPANPYSKVYNKRELAADFPDFDLTRSYHSFMHAPPLPVGWLPLENVLGWHWWVHLHPKKAILEPQQNVRNSRPN